MAGGIGGLPSFGFGDAPRPSRQGGWPVFERADMDASATSTLPRRRRIRELPPTDRPRERLALRGPGGLTSAELIALLWGSGSGGRSAVDLAEDALGRHDGLTGLPRATDVELEAIPRVGRARAAQLAAAFELGRRLLADPPPGRWTIPSPRHVADPLPPPA